MHSLARAESGYQARNCGEGLCVPGSLAAPDHGPRTLSQCVAASVFLDALHSAYLLMMPQHSEYSLLETPVCLIGGNIQLQ